MQFKLHMTHEPMKKFMSHRWAQGHGGVRMEEYEHAYTGEAEWMGSEQATLEGIYMMMNNNRPADYTARSMSVSDVVELEDGSLWFCDIYGFVRIGRREEHGEAPGSS